MRQLIELVLTSMAGWSVRELFDHLMHRKQTRLIEKQNEILEAQNGLIREIKESIGPKG